MGAPQNRLSVTVTEAVFAGERCRYMLQAGDGTAIVLKEPSSARDPPARGRRAGRDRLVGRGYDPCLRRAYAEPRPPLALAVARPLGASFAWRRAVPMLLAAPLLVFMLAFYALPVVTMLMRSVSDPVWTRVALRGSAGRRGVPEGLLEHASTPRVIVTLGALLLGYPVALALVRAPRWAPLILILILLPFWTSVLVRSYAWMVLMGRHGPDQRGADSPPACSSGRCASSTRRSPRRSR